MLGLTASLGDAVISLGSSLLADVDSQVHYFGEGGGVLPVCVCGVCRTWMCFLRPEDKLRCHFSGTITLFEAGCPLGLELVE